MVVYGVGFWFGLYLLLVCDLFLQFNMSSIINHSNSTAAQNVAINSNSQFSLSFINIRGLRANLNQVNNFLLTGKPHVLFLTETQIPNPLDTTHLLCPIYQLHHSFHFKAGVCAYVNSDLPATRFHEFVISTPGFHILGLKISLPRDSKFICCIYILLLLLFKHL